MLLNDPGAAVAEAIAGFKLAHGDVVDVDLERQLVVRKGAPVRGKVGVLSGGGSGHDPLDLGYVGSGMLDAAIPGSIFTSPTPDRILDATRAVDGGAGVLYVVKNYTGDVMNFGLAAAAAREEGTDVEIVLVADDVAGNGAATPGRRGTGATVLVERMAGAAAESGASLAAVAEVARRVSEHSRSFGVALRSCSTLTLGRPNYELADDEIELGIGIHGEPGVRRGPMQSAADLVAQMVEAIVADLDPEPGTELLALVNGFGATPLMELYVSFNDLVSELSARDLVVRRSLVGNYVTSLDMAGSSITLLVLDDELVELWDSPVDTVGLRWR